MTHPWKVRTPFAPAAPATESALEACGDPDLGSRRARSGFAKELARQCQAEATLSVSPQGRAEAKFWNAIAIKSWDDIDLGDSPPG